MSSLTGLTGRLLGQLVDQWGSLSPVSVEILSAQSGVPLPAPWERLSLDHVRGLESALQGSPALAYHVAAGIGIEEDALRELGDSLEPAVYAQVRQDHERWTQTHPKSNFQVPATFRKIASRQDEHEALGIFRKLSREDLNQVLWMLYQGGELHSLLNDFSSFLLWWGNKKTLVTLLTKERLADLTIPVRAALVLAMQQGITSGVMEEGITNVLTGTRGEDLTRLKGVIDRFSPQDLQKLVHVDIGARRRRNRILRHIGAEAANVRPDIPLVGSDIDDTLYRNYIDARYPDDTVYPGVVAFYRALGKYTMNDWERRGPTFISARPRERIGIVEDVTVESIRSRTGFRYPTVLLAGVLTLIGSGMARSKFENFVSYHNLFPEFSKILFGDNGQQDPEFCRDVVTAYAEAVAAAFIHNVTGEEVERLMGYTFEVIEPPAGARRIFYFDTYIGAALAAFEMDRPLISLADLQEVVREAQNDVDWIEFESPSQEGVARSLLDRDRQIVERKYGKVDI